MLSFVNVKGFTTLLN